MSSRRAGKDIRYGLVNMLDMLLLLHADHEQNCSRRTVRQLLSLGVDLFSALPDDIVLVVAREGQ